MSLTELDHIFPYLFVAYGALMTFILNSRRFVRLSQAHLPLSMQERFRLHRGMAFVALIVGSLWSLQQMWLGS